MTHITEAIYTQGVLKPVGPLNLPDQQRVRLVVEPINGNSVAERTAAVERLRQGIAQMNFRLRSPLPSRGELHDRA